MRALSVASNGALGFTCRLWHTWGGWLAIAFALACGDPSNQGSAAADPERAAAELDAAPRCELPGGGYPGSCNECLAARCCAPIQACQARAECAAELDCMVACQYASDPPACSRACLAVGRDPDYVAYDDCSFEECRDPCWL